MSRGAEAAVTSPESGKQLARVWGPKIPGPGEKRLEASRAELARPFVGQGLPQPPRSLCHEPAGHPDPWKMTEAPGQAHGGGLWCHRLLSCPPPAFSLMRNRLQATGRGAHSLPCFGDTPSRQYLSLALGTCPNHLAPGEGGDKPEDHNSGHDGSSSCEPQPLGKGFRSPGPTVGNAGTGSAAWTSHALVSPGRPWLAPERAGDSGRGTLLCRNGPWRPRCGNPALLPSIGCQPTGGHRRAQILLAFVLGSPSSWWAPGLCWCSTASRWRNDLPKVTLPGRASGDRGPCAEPRVFRGDPAA